MFCTILGITVILFEISIMVIAIVLVIKENFFTKERSYYKQGDNNFSTELYKTLPKAEFFIFEKGVLTKV